MYTTLAVDTIYTPKTRHTHTFGTKSSETACLDVGRASQTSVIKVDTYFLASPSTI